jgi:hypothetical protein
MAIAQVTVILSSRCHSNADFKCGLSHVETVQTQSDYRLFLFLFSSTSASNVIRSSKAIFLKEWLAQQKKFQHWGTEENVVGPILP